MIDELKYIKNVGRFETVDQNSDVAFKELSLVYSENGRGKSTLSAILRSLTTGDAAPILERRRLSAKAGSSRVVVRFDGRGKEAVFNGSAWTAAGPEVLVFDGHFVDSNICSGLSVSPGHGQNLHELVIGEEGVRCNQLVQDLTQEIETHQSDVRKKERAIPGVPLNGLSVDDFCGLSTSVL